MNLVKKLAERWARVTAAPWGPTELQSAEGSAQSGVPELAPGTAHRLEQVMALRSVPVMAPGLERQWAREPEPGWAFPWAMSSAVSTERDLGPQRDWARARVKDWAPALHWAG